MEHGRVNVYRRCIPLYRCVAFLIVSFARSLLHARVHVIAIVNEITNSCRVTGKRNLTRAGQRPMIARYFRTGMIRLCRRRTPLRATDKVIIVCARTFVTVMRGRYSNRRSPYNEYYIITNEK